MTIQEAIKERHMVRTYSDGNRSSITGAVDGG